MATYHIETDKGTFEVETDEPSQQTPLDVLKQSAQQVMAPIASVADKLQPKNLTGLLPTAGMMAGTAVLPGPGTAAGAGLGSIAQRMADLAYGQGASSPEPGTSFAPKEAIWPVANTVMAGIPETTEGQAAGQAIADKVGPVLNSAKQSFKKGFPKLAQAFTGKSAAKVGQIIEDPTAILPESLGGAMSVEKASSNYGEALANDKTLIPLENGQGFTRGITKTEFSPFSRGSKEAEEKAQMIWDKWKAGENINAQEAFDAKRATDKLWPTVVKERNAEQIRQLSEFKTAMDDVLSNQGAGPFQKASKDYARARLGADFTQLFPRTKTGDISTVKTLLLHTLAPGKTVGLLAGGATAPITTGVGNLAVQGTMKGLNTIAQNPQARQILLNVLQRLMQNKNAK